MMNVAEGFARETDNEFIRSLATWQPGNWAIGQSSNGAKSRTWNAGTVRCTAMTL